MADFTPKQMEPPQVASPEELPTRRVHILGMGSIGTLVAHSLKTFPNPPPITLMMRGDNQYNSFKSTGSLIRLVDKANDVNDEQFDYDLDVHTFDENHPGTGKPYWVRRYACQGGRPNGKVINPITEAERMESGEAFIYCLIVSVKAQQTVAALKPVRHRIDSRSTICLMQNGLGQVDQLNREVFTDPNRRPTYLLGIISHGCYMDGPNTVVHAGFGATSLGIYRDTDKYPIPPKSLPTNKSELSESDRKKYYPTDEELYSPLSSRYLLRTMTRSPTLACAPYPYLDLLQLQLEKLSSNALLNPITALLDIPNGATLNNKHLSTVQNLLLAEISLVIRTLPELQPLPNIQQRFSAERLKNLLIGVTQKTAQNSSSMREDIRRHREQTEIEYINGYIVKRGEELGIQCALNFMVVQMIKGKAVISARAGGDVIPYDVGQVKGEFKPFGERGSGEDGEGDGNEGGIVIEDVGTTRRGETS